MISSTGTPTYFLHGTEAVHGSCGQLVPGDVVIFISNSGETAEMRSTVLAVKNNGCKVIGVSGKPMVTEVLDALLSVINVEKAEVMLPDDGSEPEIFGEFRKQLGGMELTGLGRWEFYDACMAENAIVLAISTGEQRVYANILLTVGCA